MIYVTFCSIKKIMFNYSVNTTDVTNRHINISIINVKTMHMAVVNGRVSHMYVITAVIDLSTARPHVLVFMIYASLT